MEFVRPLVVVSQCPGCAACRNARVIHEDFAAQLAPHVDFQSTASCPDDMRDFDGLVLENRSPSRGAAGVTAYLDGEGAHFLTRLYALARLRSIAAQSGASALVEFQGRYKYVLMTYSPQRTRTLGRIVANIRSVGVEQSIAAYRAEFALALSRAPRRGSHINTMMHILGYFSDQLTAAEKALLLDLLQEYGSGRASLARPLGVLRAWTARFEQPYLAAQAWFEPYPRELASLAEPGTQGS